MTAAAYAAVNGTAGMKRDPFNLFTVSEDEKNLVYNYDKDGNK